MERKGSTDDIFYEAMRTRDPRFDGKFFVGVKTTGIYCRPICPAKPKRENVEFFPSHLAAEKAGYRPCLRCRPESAPESPAWMGKSAIVRRAIKTLHHQETMDFDEDRFAALFGVSARHLRRVFVEEIGKTPKQLSFESRLNLARKLLVETALPITEIAFASGFQSIRRFNDAFKDRFTKAPREVRRLRVPLSKGIRLTLSYRPPHDFAGLMHFYRTHRVGNLEWYDDGKMHRVLQMDGKVGTVVVGDDPERSRLLVDIDFPDTSKLHAILTRVRRVFDVDSDPVIIANSLELDAGVKAVLRRHPGIRLPSGWDGFEVAVATILGQVVSVERGQALVTDLIELHGEDSGIEHGGKRIKLFPTPERLAVADLTAIKTTGARKRTIAEMSKAIAEGRLSLSPTQDVDAFLEKFLELPGIGPWSASYIALKVLRHTDAFPETDLILARALEKHPKDVLAPMSPWRGYAAALFWREYSQTLSKASRKSA